MSAAAILAFPVQETSVHCGECGKGLDPEHQFASECVECGAWMCKNEACQHCECDRLAVIVKRSLDRLYPSVWNRVRRLFNRGI
jgi:hypothetical protein